MNSITALIMPWRKYEIRHISEAFAVFAVDCILYDRLISWLDNGSARAIKSCWWLNEDLVLKARIIRRIKHAKDLRCVPKTLLSICT